MSDLKSRLAEAVGTAFRAEGLPGELARVAASDRPDLADFQSNGAMAAAKLAKANPRAIADRVAQHLRADAGLASVEVAGPGFVNLRVKSALLSQRVGEIEGDALAGAAGVAQPRRVLVDYGGPNGRSTSRRSSPNRAPPRWRSRAE